MYSFISASGSGTRTQRPSMKIMKIFSVLLMMFNVVQLFDISLLFILVFL